VCERNGLECFLFRSYFEGSVEEFPEILRLYVQYDLMDGELLAAAGDRQIRQCTRLEESVETSAPSTEREKMHAGETYPTI